MARQSSYLTSFARAHCLQLPPATDDAWDWQLRGNCSGYPLELFFPEDPTRAGLHQREDAAKRICRQCPVVAECRDYALRTPELHGIWGAMTARERARELMGRGVGDGGVSSCRGMTVRESRQAVCRATPAARPR